MIKDIVVNLTVGAQRDVAADYAVSLGRTVGAHVAGIGFCYEVVVPGSVFGSVAVSLIQAQRTENEKAANAAIANFEQSARLAGVSFERRLITASLVDGVDMFGRMTRRYDLSVVAQAEPDRCGPRQIIEAALFNPGRPVVIVPYIQTTGAQARSHHGVLGRQPQCRARHRRRHAVAAASRAVEIVVASESATEQPPCRGEFAEHLARHGLKVELRRIVGRQHRRAQDHPLACRRRWYRPHRHGRLRPLASARIRAGGCDAWNSHVHDSADPDGALSGGRTWKHVPPGRTVPRRRARSPACCARSWLSVRATCRC